MKSSRDKISLLGRKSQPASNKRPFNPLDKKGRTGDEVRKLGSELSGRVLQNRIKVLNFTSAMTMKVRQENKMIQFTLLKETSGYCEKNRFRSKYH